MRSTTISFPRGANQGPSTWYLLHFHFTIRFGPRGGPAGVAYVSAATNGYTAAQAKFGVGRGKRPKISWSTLDIVNGSRHGRTRSRSLEVRFTNYLQVRGVRGGPGALSFRLEQFGRPNVRSVVIWPDTRVTATSQGPAELALSAEPHERDGGTVELRIRITNSGDRPARNVVVKPEFPDPSAIQLIGPQRIRIPVIRGQSEWQGTFAMRLLRKTAYVGIFARSTANRPGTLIRVRQVSGPHFLQAIARLRWQILVTLALGGLFALIIRRDLAARPMSKSS